MRPARTAWLLALWLALPAWAGADDRTAAHLQPWLALAEASAAREAHGHDRAKAQLLRAQKSKAAAGMKKRELKLFDAAWHKERALQARAADDHEARLAAARTWAQHARGPERAEALVEVHGALTALSWGHEAHDVAATILTEHVATAAALSLEQTHGVAALSAEQRVRRIERLIVASRMERALAEARAAPRRPGALDAPLEVATIKALVRNGKDQEAAAYAAPLANRDDAPVSVKKAHAWAVGKAGRAKDASLLYQALVEPEADPAEKSEVCFLSGFLAYEADDFARAEERLTACQPVLAGHGREAAALWYRAWIAWRRGDAAASATLLQKLLTEHPSDPEVHKHRYWYAMTQQKLGRADRAKKAWARIGRQDPIGYYGLLARRRLGQPPLTAPVLPEGSVSAEPGHDAASRESWALYAAGFKKAAQARARDRAQGKRLDVVRAQRVGDYFYGYRNGPAQVPRPRVSGGRLRNTTGWRASYAEPHRDIVVSAAQKYKLQPSLAYAIMRTESGFLENAVSVAGAVGLMQLMPYTARGMAKRLGQPPPRFVDVQDKERVVELGVAFLAASTAEFGTLWLAAACYNGAPQNVVKWMKKHQGEDPVTFMENIPFRETRNYAKKILATEAVYRGLRTGTVRMALDESVPVPAPPARYTWFSPADNEG